MVGFYEDAYKEQVDQLVADGIVRFHGFQTDVHPFYEAADCVVLPSYHEACPTCCWRVPPQAAP